MGNTQETAERQLEAIKFLEISKNKPLTVHIKNAVEHYLTQSGEQQPSNLYSLVLSEVEKPLIETVLIYANWHQITAAKILGLSRSTLQRKIQQYGIGQYESLNKNLKTKPVPTHESIQTEVKPLDKAVSLQSVHVFLEQGDQYSVQKVVEAMSYVFNEFGLIVTQEDPPIIGSWFKRWTLSLLEDESSATLKKRIAKLEKVVELKLIKKDQADVDKKEAEAAGILLDALRDQKNAVCQIGTILIVKIAGRNGETGDVIIRTLEDSDIDLLSANPSVLQQPDKVLEYLDKNQLLITPDPLKKNSQISLPTKSNSHS